MTLTVSPTLNCRCNPVSITCAPSGRNATLSSAGTGSEVTSDICIIPPRCVDTCISVVAARPELSTLVSVSEDWPALPSTKYTADVAPLSAGRAQALRASSGLTFGLASCGEQAAPTSAASARTESLQQLAKILREFFTTDSWFKEDAEPALPVHDERVRWMRYGIDPRTRITLGIRCNAPALFERIKLRIRARYTHKAGIELLGIGLRERRRIAIRIHTDEYESQSSGVGTQRALSPRPIRKRGRTHIRAVRVPKVHKHNIALFRSEIKALPIRRGKGQRWRRFRILNDNPTLELSATSREHQAGNYGEFLHPESYPEPLGGSGTNALTCD